MLTVSGSWSRGCRFAPRRGQHAPPTMHPHKVCEREVPTDRTTQGSFHQCCKRQRARLRGRIDDVQTASAMPFPRGPAGTLPSARTAAMVQGPTSADFPFRAPLELSSWQVSRKASGIEFVCAERNRGRDGGAPLPGPCRASYAHARADRADSWPIAGALCDVNRRQGSSLRCSADEWCLTRASCAIPPGICAACCGGLGRSTDGWWETGRQRAGWVAARYTYYLNFRGARA